MKLDKHARIKRSRTLRRRETDAEPRLWTQLRARRIIGLKFRRQHPIPMTQFVADFCCFERMLLIEVDGGIHEEQREWDAARQEALESLGYRVLRFTNEQVLADIFEVVASIRSACDRQA